MTAEQKIDRLLEEATTAKDLIVVVRGNKKYEIGISKKFYNDIKKIVEKVGYSIKFVDPIAYTPLPKAKAYIVFSKGGSRGKWIKKPTAYLGAPDHFQSFKNPEDINLLTPGDKTHLGDLSKTSLEKHWTLLPENAKKLEKWLRSLK
jgi:hypothetical protein